MNEPPLAALRRKPLASIRVAADLVARGDAHALFSAGHTGATFLAAHAALGVIRGVERPALAVTIPTRSGVAVLVDAGANLGKPAGPPHAIWADGRSTRASISACRSLALGCSQSEKRLARATS